MAEIDWAAAITALDARHLPCSGGRNEYSAWQQASPAGYQ